MTARPPKTHVFIIDGTLSRLVDGHESNAGLLYKLLTENGATARQSVGYDAGIQGHGWRKWINVAAGVTINLSIMEGYAALSSRYEPGDRIMLFGYSRGAYAVRSLAGMIERLGLLQRQHAVHRRVERAFRYYEAGAQSPHAHQFSRKFCRRDVPIEVLGVWDTVVALGLPYPILNRLAPMATEFHDHKLGSAVRRAYQALALDETRTSFDPLPWQRQPGWRGVLDQRWFPGTHGDVGGQIGGIAAARPLSNLSLVWMLERAEDAGLLLPDDWRARFPTDPAAPMAGNMRGWGKFFVLRAPRIAGQCGSESSDPSVAARMAALRGYRPRARWVTHGDMPPDAQMGVELTAAR